MNTNFTMSSNFHEHNLEYIGPGIWYVIHKTAITATDGAKIDFFLTLLKVVVKNLGLKCKNHAQDYINQHPPNDYREIIDENTGERIGMFYWSWEFHNDVNLRLGKNQMTFEEAYNLYKNPEEVASCSLKK
jgi:hypothetical protein